jgi:hypothetical protein
MSHAYDANWILSCRNHSYSSRGTVKRCCTVRVSESFFTHVLTRSRSLWLACAHKRLVSTLHNWIFLHTRTQSLTLTLTCLRSQRLVSTLHALLVKTRPGPTIQVDVVLSQVSLTTSQPTPTRTHISFHCVVSYTRKATFVLATAKRFLVLYPYFPGNSTPLTLLNHSTVCGEEAQPVTSSSSLITPHSEWWTGDE